MDSLEILPGFHAVGLTLHIPKHDALVFADTHLGFEEALNRQGVMVPRFQFRTVVEHLRQAIGQTRPKTLVINGDLKHEFGRVKATVWDEVVAFLDELGDMDVVLVRGNHDAVIGPVAGRVRVQDSLKLGTTLVLHGHKTPKGLELTGVKTIVIGHEHPCIGLREEGRVEKVKCFLCGRWKGRYLIALPSLNYVTEGVDVLAESLMSPFLLGDISGFKAYGVAEGRVIAFGELGGICRL